MKTETSPLSRWMAHRMATIHDGKTDYKTGRNDVSILSYFFIPEMTADNESAAFRDVQCAIRETWLNCGLMPTIVVANRPMDCLEMFASEFAPHVGIQIEPSLVPGRIFSMSRDCNGKLAARFKTDYVLIVQNDGFPLRPGLDDFVGKYDFIGAPYVRNFWYNRLICHVLGCWVSNGGFSLRSRAICEKAAYYWEKKYKNLPESTRLSEDLFYTKELPLRYAAFRRSVKIAPPPRALAFSFDTAAGATSFPGQKLPFGFHGEGAFELLSERFKLV